MLNDHNNNSWYQSNAAYQEAPLLEDKQNYAAKFVSRKYTDEWILCHFTEKKPSSLNDWHNLSEFLDASYFLQFSPRRDMLSPSKNRLFHRVKRGANCP